MKRIDDYICLSCDRRNVSLNFPCVCVWLSSGDLFLFLLCCNSIQMNCSSSKEKFDPGPGFETPTSRSLAWSSITCPILFQLTAGLNRSPKSNAMQVFVVFDTICHHLTSELTSSLFIPVRVRIFLSNINCNSSRHKLWECT